MIQILIVIDFVDGLVIKVIVNLKFPLFIGARAILFINFEPVSL